MTIENTIFSFPSIDPVAISFGPLQIRWYALAYISAFMISWLFLKFQIKKSISVLSEKNLESLLNATLIGVIIGGRLGYVFFYNYNFYLSNLVEILKVWNGGMSFHGGFLGVCLAICFVSKKEHINLLKVSDEVALVAPIGLFFGRIANFINAELYGKKTDFFLGIIFPNAGNFPRHPSQLYEAFFEGIVIFIILMYIRIKYKFIGLITFQFIFLYGIFRFLIEFFREPDFHIGFIFSLNNINFTIGQTLSFPMILIGLIGIIKIKKQNNYDDNK